jgi:hypothetical protein
VEAEVDRLEEARLASRELHFKLGDVGRFEKPERVSKELLAFAPDDSAQH